MAAAAALSHTTNKVVFVRTGAGLLLDSALSLRYGARAQTIGGELAVAGAARALSAKVAVAINLGSFSWMSLYYEPY